MENKNWHQKLIEVIKKRDSRFWLMIFVVVSTLSVLVVWVMDVRNVFSGDNSWDEELSLIKSDASNKQLEQDLVDLSSFLDNIILEDQPSPTNISESSEVENSNSNDLDKIIEAVNLKLSEQGDENMIVSNINDSQSENNSSSDPILSLELDESDQSLSELRKRIEELEEKLED